jgi:hypothetical protein
VLQLKNYAGSCREECERRASEFPILQRAIEEADRYFEALRKVRQSSISAMEVAGYRQAARLHARRFSNAISKGSEDASVFMSFFKKARLLYGKTWSSFHDGKLGKSFFSHFGYICSQFGDFRHGSDEWTKQLVPNWLRFLEDLLKENADERSVRLLPVALIILREHGNNNSSAETGWIDLSEWAMLAAWRVHQATEKNSIKDAVFQMWVGFYLVEMDRFYQQHSGELAVEHSLETRGAGNYIDSVAAAVVAFWHIARLGILGMSYAELLQASDDEQKKVKSDALKRVANWLVSLLNANPAANRPLLDLHHIELFLIWRTLWQLHRTEDIFKWLHALRSNLLVRRAGTVPIPFIEGGNSLDLVFEHVATGEKPPEFSDQSSLLVLSILEFCFGLEPAKRNELLAAYYQQIVLGQDPVVNN